MSNINDEMRQLYDAKVDELTTNCQSLVEKYKSLLTKFVDLSLKQTLQRNSDIDWDISVSDLLNEKDLRGSFDEFEVFLDSQFTKIRMQKTVIEEIVLDKGVELEKSPSTEFLDDTNSFEEPVILAPAPNASNENSDLSMEDYFNDTVKELLISVCDKADDEGLDEVWFNTKGASYAGVSFIEEKLNKELTEDEYEELVDIICESNIFQNTFYSVDSNGLRLMKGGNKNVFYTIG